MTKVWTASLSISLSSLIVAWVPSAHAQSLQDINFCTGAGSLDQAVKSCSLLIGSTDRNMVTQRFRFIMFRAVAFFKNQHYDDAILGFTDALVSAANDPIFRGSKDTKFVEFMEKNQRSTRAFAFYGRGVARLAKGDKGGNLDIAEAKKIDPDIENQATKFGIK